MSKYFYTCDADECKIYVFWNFAWLNQLIKINGSYCWMSLNECGSNWDSTGKSNMQDAIECAMESCCDVYQLDTLEELAEFIKPKGA